MRHKRFLVAVSALVLSAAIARAQTAPSWTQNNAYQAWEGYKSYFYTSGAGGGDIIADQKGGNQWTSMWKEAEEIEVAEDAFYWAKRNGFDTSNYVTHINDLCTGFVDNMTQGYIGPLGKLDWSGDNFNDDLMWASIAFARAYQITHTTVPLNWLTAAENQFNTVWKRAQANDSLNGGLIQSNQKPGDQDWVPVEDAPVNFTFVIAGYLLYDITADQTYKDHADAVYAWASKNLFSYADAGPACTGQTGRICVKINDSNNRSIPEFPGYCVPTTPTDCIGRSDFTYNYGTAIQAAAREGDAANAQNIANYLMFNLDNQNSPYAQPPYVVGNIVYNILPNYKNTPSGSNGYNGIALRGVGLGLDRNVLDTTTKAWAQANLQAAWNNRNSDTDNVMWNDWVSHDYDLYTYLSWDCSDAVAGMLDIAPPN